MVKTGLGRAWDWDVGVCFVSILYFIREENVSSCDRWTVNLGLE